MKLINSEQLYARAPAKPMRLGSVDLIGDLSLFLDQAEQSRFEFWEVISLADAREDCIDRELVFVLLLGPVGSVRAAPTCSTRERWLVQWS